MGGQFSRNEQRKRPRPEINNGLWPHVAYLMETCAAGFIGAMR